MNEQLLNRRDFNGLWVALGSSFFSVGTMIAALPSASVRAATLMVKFHDGTIVPALGQGSANLAQGRRPDAVEEEALRTGLSLGMTLIHEIAEQLLTRQLVVRRDIEDVHVALAARSGIAGAFAGADHVKPFIVRRKHKPVGVGKLVLGDNDVEPPARVDTVDICRQLTLAPDEAGGLIEPRIEMARLIARTPGDVRLAFIELAAIGRVGEPDATVWMGDNVVGRIEAFALVGVGDHRHRSCS